MKRVAIIGGGIKERDFWKMHKQTLGENDDPTLEIWGLNAIRYHFIPFWSRMFNLHTFENLEKYGWPIEREIEWKREHPDIPFYTMGKWPVGEGKMLEFPRRFIEDALPRARHNYHCSTIDWLVAYAIALGTPEIILHSINWSLAADEPISARACLEYWCGFAEASGIIVSQDERCDNFCFIHIVKSNLIYGPDDTPIFEDRRIGAKTDVAPYRYD